MFEVPVLRGFMVAGRSNLALGFSADGETGEIMIWDHVMNPLTLKADTPSD
jgi:hypothetical protein